MKLSFLLFFIGIGLAINGVIEAARKLDKDVLGQVLIQIIKGSALILNNSSGLIIFLIIYRNTIHLYKFINFYKN